MRDVVCAVASEEEPLPRSCVNVMGYNVTANRNPLVVGGTKNMDGLSGGRRVVNLGEYVALFDLIDGSKNIDSSLLVRTIAVKAQVLRILMDSSNVV